MSYQAVVVDRLKNARDPNDRLSALNALQVPHFSMSISSIPICPAQRYRSHTSVRLASTTAPLPLTFSKHATLPVTQGLARDAPGLVSAQAMPVVVDLLRARHLGQLDDATAQNVLELLQGLIGSPMGGTAALQVFLKSPSNLDALLDLLEGTDTLTTVTTLQVRRFSRDSISFKDRSEVADRACAGIQGDTRWWSIDASSLS